MNIIAHLSNNLHVHASDLIASAVVLAGLFAVYRLWQSRRN